MYYFYFIEDDLLKEVQRLESLYYSENTKRTRSVQLRRYEEFCRIQGFVCFPLVSVVMRKYVAHLGKDLCYSSIQQYLSAIIVHSRILGYPDETRESLGLLWILGGIKRWKGDLVISSSCLFPADLLGIRDLLDLRKMEDMVFWVSCLIMFRTLLRGSNLFDSDMAILYEDVKCTEWGVLFTIRKTKTIQYKQRLLEIPVALVPGHPLCLIKCLKLVLDYSGTGPGLPLLGWSNKGRFVGASYKWFVDKLKILCEKMKLVGKYGTHSFRHGGATTLSMVGMELSDISKKGDWKSLCVLRYLNRPLVNVLKEEKFWSKKVLDFVF